jgi:hypothetical protein
MSYFSKDDRNPKKDKNSKDRKTYSKINDLEKEEKEELSESIEFEESKAKEQIMIDTMRSITIIVWGRLNHNWSGPEESQEDFNVCNISNKENMKGFDTRKLTGRNDDLRNKIMSTKKAQGYMKMIIESIEKNNHACISIYCDHGKHRSMSMAYELKAKYYKNSQIINLDN